MYFQIFHNATIVIQRIRNLWYDVRIRIYIHTYIHTDTTRVQHVNVGLAQAHPNYRLFVCTVWFCSSCSGGCEDARGKEKSSGRRVLQEEEVFTGEEGEGV